MDAMRADRARELVADWERHPDHTAACEFFRPGQFDLNYGEHRCNRCAVPESTHRAYRVLNTMVVSHG